MAEKPPIVKEKTAKAAAEKNDRLSQALRENLKKRKAQSRARKSAVPDDASEA